MTAHLSDEQFTKYLSGEEDAPAQVHLNDCEHCRAQARRLLDIVGASRAHVERSSDRHPNFWTLQRNEVRYAAAIRRPQRPTWAIASALAALLVLSTFMFQTQQPRPDSPHVAQAPSISDDALLSEVNSTLDQDVPSALVPVQRLAFEREEAEHNTQSQVR